MIVSIVDPNSKNTDPTTMTSIHPPIFCNFTDAMFTIAGSIDGGVDFVLGFTADDIYVGKTDTHTKSSSRCFPPPSLAFPLPLTHTLSYSLSLSLSLLCTTQTECISADGSGEDR